jgi:hypothetical protein
MFGNEYEIWILETLQVKVTEVSCIKKAGSRSDLLGIEYKDDMEQADDYRSHSENENENHQLST